MRESSSLSSQHAHARPTASTESTSRPSKRTRIEKRPPPAPTSSLDNGRRTRSGSTRQTEVKVQESIVIESDTEGDDGIQPSSSGLAPVKTDNNGDDKDYRSMQGEYDIGLWQGDAQALFFWRIASHVHRPFQQATWSSAPLAPTPLPSSPSISTSTRALVSQETRSRRQRSEDCRQSRQAGRTAVEAGQEVQAGSSVLASRLRAPRRPVLEQTRHARSLLDPTTAFSRR